MRKSDAEGKAQETAKAFKPASGQVAYSVTVDGAKPQLSPKRRQELLRAMIEAT